MTPSFDHDHSQRPVLANKDVEELVLIRIHLVRAFASPPADSLLHPIPPIQAATRGEVFDFVRRLLSKSTTSSAQRLLADAKAGGFRHHVSNSVQSAQAHKLVPLLDG